jgi:hypothetical protein
MREQLIRYLLGELDADERRELRVQLRQNPELQRELEQLRACFAANQDDDAEELPPGRLAERTADRISNSDEYELEAAIAAGATRMSTGGDPPSGVLGWSLADLTVAGGVMLAVSMLVFPALRDSRDGTWRTVCQDNQRQLWFLVSEYAANNGDYFPRIRPNETAGKYVLDLIKGDYERPGKLRVLVVCPSSPIADQIRRGKFAFHLPSGAELRAMNPAQQKVFSCSSSPTYGYALPSRIGDGYLYPKSGPTGHSGSDPLIGDLSGNPLNALEAHHRGGVIQTVSADGRMRSFRFEAESAPIFEGDFDIYHNDLNIVSAGLRPHDVVLGTSDAMPGLEFALHERSWDK